MRNQAAVISRTTQLNRAGAMGIDPVEAGQFRVTRFTGSPAAIIALVVRELTSLPGTSGSACDLFSKSVKLSNEKAALKGAAFLLRTPQPRTE